MDAAEETLFSIASGNTPTADERALLSSLGLIGPRLESETIRVKRVVRWREKTGTAAEREKAADAANAAAAALAARRPEIAAELQRLQVELAALEDTAAQTHSVVVKQAEAVQALTNRDLLPGHLQAQYDDLRRTGQPTRARLAELETTINIIAGLATMKPEDRAAVDFAEGQRLPCYILEQVSHDTRRGRVDAAGWTTYVRGRQSEVDSLKAEQGELQQRLEEAKASEKALLSFYVK